MTLRTDSADLFPACRSRKIDVDFEGGEITSDAGLLLLRQVDRRLGLTAAAGRCLPDSRRKGSCVHGVMQMLRQRVYGLAAGYEDLNDHDTLRTDLMLQTAVDREVPLASSPTLCRLENSVGREAAVDLHKVLLEQFIGSFEKPPEELVLDFDATDNPVHGMQEGRFFHGYYDHYCFLPLYVFCGDQLLVAYLRESRIDPARHAWAILALLVRRLRAEWPDVRIIFRADSGFCRHRMLGWMERNGVGYVVGIAKNSVLGRRSEDLQRQAEAAHLEEGRKVQLLGEIRYAAGTWKTERRVVVRAEHGPQGANPRFVVTNLGADPETVYRKVYCARGEMENRIKEQMMLFSDRTSAHKWWANQFRLLLSGLAYVLMERLRAIGLEGSELEEAECRTIRLKLIKIGAVLTRNTRRIRVHLSSAFPRQDLFWQVARRLAPG